MINKENRTTSKKWSKEELFACVAVYQLMVKKANNGEEFKKVDYYRALAEEYDRNDTIYPLRFQNITHVMNQIEAPVIPNSKPATGIGGHNRQYVIEAYYHLVGEEIPEEIKETFPKNKVAMTEEEKAEAKRLKEEAKKEAAEKRKQEIAEIKEQIKAKIAEELKAVKAEISEEAKVEEPKAKSK